MTSTLDIPDALAPQFTRPGQEIDRRTALQVSLLAAVLRRYWGEPGISPEERKKRAEAFRQAEASLRLSGLKIDSKARLIFERYVSGELTLAGMGMEIDALHEREFGPLARPEKFVRQCVAQIPRQRKRPC